MRKGPASRSQPHVGRWARALGGVALAVAAALAHAQPPRTGHSSPAGGSAIVKIGLLSPRDGTRQAEGLEVRRGAELAVAEVNAAGRGPRLELLERPDDGLWGAGIRQMTRLAFTDRVSALMGGVESESAHLIEQLSQKARVVYLMPWTGDRTLTQAGVPWVFSCVPNDEQRARGLVRDAFGTQRLTRVGILFTADRTARLAAREFGKVAAKAGRLIPADLQWQVAEQRPGAPDPLPQALAYLEQARPQAVVLFAPSAAAQRIRQVLRQRRPGLPVLQPRLPAAPGHPFYRRYRQRYGRPPAPPAAFAYDAVHVLARALASLPAGQRDDHDAIREAVMRVRYRGATGEIRFDRRGNRIVP